MHIEGVKNFYRRFERHISSASLLGGFLFDIFTLKRVDLFLENFWVIVHLLMAATGIFLLNLYGEKSAKIHFWLIIAIQFAFGGLLSVFLVFYFRSANLAVSWPFLLILMMAFIGNEAFKHRYSRLGYQVAILFLSIYSFFIFFVPVVVHQIGDKIFLLSGAISLLAISFFIFLLAIFTREKFKQSGKRIVASVAIILFLVNTLYFTNIIPPIPLSLKEAGIFHSVVRNAGGNYDVQYEQQPWYQFFQAYEVFHQVPGEPIYVYSAIFSPTTLNTTITHQWQYYDETEKKWVDSGKIDLPIVGGRDGGYRTYSLRSDLADGYWRVNALTETGQSVGRISFKVESSSSEPVLESKTIN
ncbi:MAG: DUF2914 domain-containing protein [bacterium]